MALPPSRSLGRYDLVDFLGAGGMGEVYRAFDRTSGEVVAVKRLRTDRTAATLARFRQEAAVHLRIRHPHVARAYELLETPDGPALVLEYVDGPSLSEYLASHAPIPFGSALALFRPIVAAVASLHREGILHRDIKPENVRLTRQGVPKLLDFGIAKDTVRDLRQSSTVFGSTPYMAPERLHGLPAVPQTDVWALGVLFYEMLTGVAPFEGTDVLDAYDRIRHAKYTPVAHRLANPDPLADALVNRCLRRQPESRFADAGALLQAVEAAEAALTPRASPPRLPRRWMGYALGAVAGVGVMVLAALAVQAPRFSPAAADASGLLAAPRLAPPNARLDTICLMSQGGREAEVLDATGHHLGTLGHGCVPFSGAFGQTYELTLLHDGASFTQPVTITHRRAWIVRLP